MKKKFLSLLVLLAAAVTGAWADDTYTVKFEANGNSKTIENVTLPKKWACNYATESGELDLIIKELYGFSDGCSNTNPGTSVTECDGKVTVVSSKDQSITINEPFEGTVTVTGKYVEHSGHDYVTFSYSLEISIPGYVAPATGDYKLTVSPENVNGTISFTVGEGDNKVENATGANEGDLVTVTVAANTGWTVDNLSAFAYTTWDAAGARRRLPDNITILNEVELQKSTTVENTWTFLMPSASVIAEAKYYALPELAWKVGDTALAENAELSSCIDFPFDQPLLDNPHQLTGIIYSSSNESVATIDADGNITLLTAGETIISATYAGDETYKDDEVSYKLTVAAPVTLTLVQSEQGELTIDGAGGSSQATDTWTKETWNGWDNNTKTHTVGDITMTISPASLVYEYTSNSSKPLSFFVNEFEDDATVTFSTEGDGFTRIELTMLNDYNPGEGNYHGVPNIQPSDGWTFEGKSAVWEGEATKTLTLTSCSTEVSSIAFYRGGSLPDGVIPNGDGTFKVIPGTIVKLKAKAAESFHVQGWKAGQTDVTDGVTFGDYYDPETDRMPATSTLTVTINADATYSAVFADNEYFLTFAAQNDYLIEEKGTVKVDQTDKTSAITNHKLEGVKRGQTVTLNAKTGYKFRKVQVKKTFEVTSRVSTTEWRGMGGMSPAFSTPAVMTSDGRETRFAEIYRSDNDGIAETGVLMQQAVQVPNGKYIVELYANSFFTPDRGMTSDMADGATDVAYVFANDTKQFIVANVGTGFTQSGLYTMEVTVTDGTLTIGIGKEKAGTNWHTIQIKSLVQVVE